MQQFYRVFLSVIFLYCFSLNTKAQGLKINEIMSSNTFVVYDEDGDTPDWVEIVNFGNTEINLSDYYLSDGKKKLV